MRQKRLKHVASLVISIACFLAHSQYSPTTPFRNLLSEEDNITAEQSSTSRQDTQSIATTNAHYDLPVDEIIYFRDAFVAAKRRVQRQLPQYGGGIMRTIYPLCLRNFSALSDVDPTLERYTQMNPSQQRKIAETFWLHQGGRLWMQHSRKGGGTSLCMSLRLNQQGLIRTNSQQWKIPERQTCQLETFCQDCDLTTADRYSSSFGGFLGWETIPRLVSCVTSINSRNFIEMEGTVSPPNILTNPEFANFVFISTIRHPISRIISALHNDELYNKRTKSCKKPQNPKELNRCSHYAISNARDILSKCHEGIYHCHSNYYVRMFAGHPTGAEHEVNHDTLEKAKVNFLRYSCVILMEQWEETAGCLSTKLGLHLTSRRMFNTHGNLDKPEKIVTKLEPEEEEEEEETSSHSTTFLESLDPSEYELLLQMNKLDNQFYEWAKELILKGYFTGRG